MSRVKKEPNSSVDKKERRKELSCSICPPNKGENAKRKPKHGVKKPKYKDKRSKHPKNQCDPGCSGCAAE